MQTTPRPLPCTMGCGESWKDEVVRDLDRRAGLWWERWRANASGGHLPVTLHPLLREAEFVRSVVDKCETQGSKVVALHRSVILILMT